MEPQATRFKTRLLREVWFSCTPLPRFLASYFGKGKRPPGWGRKGRRGERGGEGKKRKRRGGEKKRKEREERGEEKRGKEREEGDGGEEGERKKRGGKDKGKGKVQRIKLTAAPLQEYCLGQVGATNNKQSDLKPDS